jgi:hypothetical protein
MVQQGHYGELNSILGAIPVHQAAAAPEAPEPEEEPGQRGGGADEDEGEEGLGEQEEDDDEEQEEEEKEEEEEEAIPAQLGQQAAQQAQQQRLRPRRLQTFVFSATLTLPASLRKRLRKGGGGASGSSDLDSLMDRIPFRCLSVGGGGEGGRARSTGAQLCVWTGGHVWWQTSASWRWGARSAAELCKQ